MVIPLYDHNPFRLPVAPLVTFGLIAANFAVFFFQLSIGEQANDAIIAAFGAVPSQIARTAPHIGAFAADSTLVTCLFLHEGWEHILGNMLFLLVFGDDIEEALGRFRFLAFYLLCGVFASLAYVAANIQSDAPLIGASGAISGILGAYLMLRPCAKVAVFIVAVVIRVPAWVVIGLWATLQVYHVANGGHGDASVAYMAHVGGLVAGVILFFVMRPRHVQLFECVWDPEASLPPPSRRNSR